MPFLGILIKGDVLSQRFALDTVLTHILLFAFKLVQCLCATVLIDGIAVLRSAGLHPPAVFARYILLRYVDSP